jgi:hypothetical protein
MGEWKLLVRAFERFCPELLPGPRWEGVLAARAQANTEGFQQPPTGPREKATPKGPKPKRELTTNGATKYMFGCAPVDFDFPLRDTKNSLKRLKDLADTQIEETAKRLRRGRLRGMDYEGLEEATRILRPDLLA